MEVGVVGKPNVGKSTTFNALTLLDVPMAPYPFTTTTPNRGVGAVRVACPHAEKGAPCDPGNAKCLDGVRWVPVNLVDVPGLVPGAHEGKGLGHKFLDDLRASAGFLQVVDASGATNPEGEIVAPGTSDPSEEVHWLERELVAWVTEILTRDFAKTMRSVELEGAKVEEFLQARLTGLSITPAEVSAALRAVPVDRDRPSTWTASDRARLSEALLRASKPRVVSANKCDRSTPEAVEMLSERSAPIPVVPTCAEAELTLRRASRGNLVRYRPGDPTFEVAPGAPLSDRQERALAEVRAVMKRWGSTGVQAALERLVFGELRQISVFPVEDEARWVDSRGRRLPDVLLVPAGTTAHAMAYRVHTDLGENFIRAIDGRTHRALAAEHPLSDGAVIRVVARK
ncbi:MAG: redox-regulated ATPase YchF [Thermoplasmata archaeon]|nr:redox-regulated ATPase YchF [Thermoplasmata archaeon]MCI4359453.1 redox-regulated ATPase YchF [Thermoplasmata archaeon]